ncbi:MAG: hypothetical protein MO853_02475 [Candidatus Protistobacter heckmanni]|nr:hypothetical protein [Candidatus Protistobacter heckmanni]
MTKLITALFSAAMLMASAAVHTDDMKKDAMEKKDSMNKDAMDKMSK